MGKSGSPDMLVIKGLPVDEIIPKGNLARTHGAEN